MLLSKKEFAETCGVQLSTVYNWISGNRADIKNYINEGMIESAIFDKEPFRHMQISREKRAPEKTTVLQTAREEEAQTAQQSEIEQLKIRVQELEKQNGTLSATVEAKQNEIERLESNLDDLRSVIAGLQADKAFLQAHIPPALPEPQGFFERLFRRKKQ